MRSLLPKCYAHCTLEFPSSLRGWPGEVKGRHRRENAKKVNLNFLEVLERGLKGKYFPLSLRYFLLATHVTSYITWKDELLTLGFIGGISRSRCSNLGLCFAPPVNTESETAVVNVTYSNREQTRQ